MTGERFTPPRVESRDSLFKQFVLETGDCKGFDRGWSTCRGRGERWGEGTGWLRRLFRDVQKKFYLNLLFLTDKSLPKDSPLP